MLYCWSSNGDNIAEPADLYTRKVALKIAYNVSANESVSFQNSIALP